MILNHVAHPLFTICVLAHPITPLRCWPADSVEEEKGKIMLRNMGVENVNIYIYIYIFVFIYFFMNKSDKNNFGQNKT